MKHTHVRVHLLFPHCEVSGVAQNENHDIFSHPWFEGTEGLGVVKAELVALVKHDGGFYVIGFTEIGFNGIAVDEIGFDGIGFDWKADKVWNVSPWFRAAPGSLKSKETI